ncbi:MAG TPA: YfdX family protein [Planctomycetes bacterium]|nr:YfdX family protein [Planctomycetota bacterium]
MKKTVDWIACRGRVLAGVALILTLAASAALAQAPSETLGTGTKYQTVVTRHTEGSLSVEDLQQATVLGARILHHLNEAFIDLTDGQPKAAQGEIENGLALSRVIREMLPVTVVETVVKNADGKVVYRATDRIQDDRIPLFHDTIAVEIVEPLVEAKKKQAAVKGVKLADTEVIYTSVLLDLGYVQRKLKRAKSLLADDNQEGALAQIFLAQTNGVEFIASKEDSPLVEAVAALRLAEDMVASKRTEAARRNLQIARDQIEIYRGLIGATADQKVHELDDEIADLMKKVEAEDAIALIRKFRNRIESWFSVQTGQAVPTKPQGVSAN